VRSTPSTTNTKPKSTVGTAFFICLDVDDNLLYMVNRAGLHDIVQLNDLVQETRRKFTYNKTHRETLKKTMDEVKVKIARALKDSKDNGKE